MAAKMKLCRCLSSANIIFACFLLLQTQFDISCAATTTDIPNATDTTTVVTTNDTTTTPAATTQPPTTTTTAAPTTTIITEPPTTTILPDQPQTEIGDTVVGQCLCDLTGNTCDINCCCDADCTAEDNSTFTCNTESIIVDNKKCFQEELFLFSNSPVQTKTENGLFCIYYDNYDQRNFYLDPDFILDIASFNTYLDDYGTAGVQGPVSEQEIVYNQDSFYKAGDPVSIVYSDDSVGDFVLPKALTSSECSDLTKMPFLQATSSTCSRIVAVLDQTTCESTATWNAASYYADFNVVKTPSLFAYVENGTYVGVTASPVQPTQPATTVVATTVDPNATPDPNASTPDPTTLPPTTQPPTTVDPTTGAPIIVSLYSNPYTLAVNATARTHLCVQTDGSLLPCTISAPSFSANTCLNVVQEARYFVTTNGTSGIADIQVQFVFTNISSTRPLAQTFSVSYAGLNDGNTTFAKSGNPGYVMGKPILYGTLISTNNPDGSVTQSIQMASDSSEGLTVVRAGATGECGSTPVSRVPLKFGENMRTGCFISLDLTGGSAATCNTIQTAILDALEGPNVPVANTAGTAWVDNNRYVATFGNTNAEKVGDWVKIIVSNRPAPGSATGSDDTCRLSMGVHIQVLYSNVGALSNPQPKIIGVALLYDDQRNVAYRCFGAFCQDTTANQTQRFEVSQTVSFIDVSQPAVKATGEAPIFIGRLPTDFFYPFLYYTSAAAPSHSSLSVIVTLCTSLIMVLARTFNMGS